MKPRITGVGIKLATHPMRKTPKEKKKMPIRKDSVPVGLREKGFWALIYLCSAVYLFHLAQFLSVIDTKSPLGA
jgi:hypothetical protein